MASPCGLAVKIHRQIGLDSAFCRVDLKSRQDRKRFCLLAVLLPCFVIGGFVVSDHTAIQCGIGNLPDTGGKGAPDRFKAGVPIAGIS